MYAGLKGRRHPRGPTRQRLRGGALCLRVGRHQDCRRGNLHRHGHRGRGCTDQDVPTDGGKTPSHRRSGSGKDPRASAARAPPWTPPRRSPPLLRPPLTSLQNRRLRAGHWQHRTRGIRRPNRHGRRTALARHRYGDRGQLRALGRRRRPVRSRVTERSPTVRSLRHCRQPRQSRDTGHSDLRQGRRDPNGATAGVADGDNG